MVLRLRMNEWRIILTCCPSLGRRYVADELDYIMRIFKAKVVWRTKIRVQNAEDVRGEYLKGFKHVSIWVFNSSRDSIAVRRNATLTRMIAHNSEICRTTSLDGRPTRSYYSSSVALSTYKYDEEPKTNKLTIWSQQRRQRDVPPG